SILGFNGSDDALGLDHVEGNVIWNLDRRNEETLPPCQVTALHWSNPIQPHQEFAIALTQRVSLTQPAALTQALGRPEPHPDISFGSRRRLYRYSNSPRYFERYFGETETCVPRIDRFSMDQKPSIVLVCVVPSTHSSCPCLTVW